MATKKASTLKKVASKVTKAAKAVAATADAYVVEPVGKALGLGKKKPARKRAAKAKAGKAPAAAKKGKATAGRKPAGRKTGRAKAAGK
jgi:hypothetical protein